MSATTNIIGGVAALNIAKSSDNANNNDTDGSSSTGHVSLKNMDDFDMTASMKPTKQTTFIATPKTSKWSTIIVLLVTSVLGLLFVIFYSVFVKDD